MTTILKNELARIEKNKADAKRKTKEFENQGSSWVKSFLWVFVSSLTLAILFNVFFYTARAMLATSRENIKETINQQYK